MPPVDLHRIKSLIEKLRDTVVRRRAGITAGHPHDELLPSRVRALGFEEKDSLSDLTQLCERFLDADATGERTVALVQSLTTSPSPSLALRNLNRFLDRASSPGVFMQTVAGAGPILAIITTVFGASQYMADILARSPGTLYWLMEQSTWDSIDDTAALREWFEREASIFNKPEAQLNAIRRAHRQALLRVGVADLMGSASVSQTTRRLSDLADVVADTVLSVVRGDDEPRLAILALGKLGGRELNYSSDIDLIYVCEDADADGIGRVTRTARRFTEAMSEITAEGYLYRVDLRLRPDGKAGPLVQTEASMRLYYESRGRPWEFQALIKARAVAGARELGTRLLDGLKKLTYSPSLSYSPLEDIANMRLQIKENIPTRERSFNIKLMAGGIRDIEFVVQAHQLMHGGRLPQLRTPTTLEALQRIVDEGLIKASTGHNLMEAYRFLRVVEHRLQMMHQLKTHTVPESTEEIASLARRVSAGPIEDFTAEEFLEELSKHLGNVRAVADTFFAGEDVHPHSALLMLPEDDERAQSIIRQYGIKDTARALRTLHTMAYGSFPRLLDRSVRSAFEELLPLLLEEVARMGDPELALINLAQIASAGKNEASFYRLLASSKAARELVVAMAGLSSLLSKRLSNQIDMLDTLVSASEEFAFETQFKELPEWERYNADLARKGGRAAEERQARQRAWLDRTRLHAFASAFSRKFRPVSDGRAHSWLALRQLAAAFDSGLGDEAVAVYALGSFAVREARMTSDVDLLVVTDGADVPDVTTRVQTINRWFTDGGILKLDFRLRGEGASAPLVQDIGFYEDYFAKRISLWERIAFAKSAFWWGSKAVRERFDELLRRVVCHPFKTREISDLTAMRTRLEWLAPKKFRTWETKRSPGGRYDIEYITAVGMANTAFDAPDFFELTTGGRLDRLADNGCLSKEEAHVCSAALELYATVEYLMELQEFALPRSIEKNSYLSEYLDRTFAFLEIPAPGGVERAIENTKSAVRVVYQQAMKRLLAG